MSITDLKDKDDILQSIVNEIPSYVKDTKYFFQKINQTEEVPEDSLLVTLDVKSLYYNIPNNEGIKQVKEDYDKHPNKIVLTKVITTFLSLILTFNNFVFNSVIYIQKMGCAMDTVCASFYGDLSMAKFQEEHMYPYIKDIYQDVKMTHILCAKEQKDR